MASPLRTLPAVHRLVAEAGVAPFAARLGATAVRTAAQEVLAQARREIMAGTNAPSVPELVQLLTSRLSDDEADGLLEVINGTGILLHTNLGRAPLAPEAAAAMARLAGTYSNLEYDLARGGRGSRYARVNALLREHTGAEDTLVVNNCAAAIYLVLDTYARGREVVVARNQAIEIGGGLRLPDMLARSGATTIEVGTTNRVYLSDYERALSIDSALLMRTHPSNFHITGFVADVDPRELAELGRRAGVATLEDLGSGALVDLAPFGLPHERTVGEAVADGIDLVTFSGDKLLGGPQAGVIAGTTAAIARLRANPLLRALRVDKATIAALAATLRLYGESGGIERIPFYTMLGRRPDALRARAVALQDRLGNAAARVTETVASVGGGAFPSAEIPSIGVAVRRTGTDAEAIAAALRRARPPLLGRVRGGEFIIDLRTIAPEHDSVVAHVLRAVLGE